MHLSIQVRQQLVPIFFQLLGQGCSLSIRTGCSVQRLLCEQLGIREDYLDRRIQTIFLNGKVVDDKKSAVVNEGDTLALSGAMPGLVGAILRSGGFYAAMRRQISFAETDPSSSERTGRITVKLLNLVVKELGPEFLAQGVWIQGRALQEFVGRYAAELSAGCLSAELDGKPIAFADLQQLDWNTDWVRLQVLS